MSCEVLIVDECNYKKYTNFILTNQESHVFHTIEWKNVIEKTFGCKPIYLMALDEYDKVRAIIPLFYVKNICSNKLESIPFSSYGGFVGDASYFPFLLKKIFDLKKELNCNRIVIKQPPIDNGFKKICKKHNMGKIANRVNHVIDLKNKNSDELWMNLHKKNRGSIRKAKKNNVKIEKMADQKDLEKIHKLNIITRKPLGLLTPSINYYKNMWDQLFPKKYIDVYLSKFKDEIIAFAIFFKLNKKIVHIDLGSNSKARDLNANNLILWKAIENSCKKGYKAFDMGASALDGNGNVCDHFKGIYNYKCSFNPENITYSWFFYPKDLKDIDAVSIKTNFTKIHEGIVRKMPISIHKKIGTSLTRKFM